MAIYGRNHGNSLTSPLVGNYNVIMKAQIIKIGNSHGIRIPKSVLEETRISGEVELDVTPEGILIRKTKKVRGDWESIFKSLSETDDDLNLTDARTDFAKKEWQW